MKCAWSGANLFQYYLFSVTSKASIKAENYKIQQFVFFGVNVKRCDSHVIAVNMCVYELGVQTEWISDEMTRKKENTLQIGIRLDLQRLFIVFFFGVRIDFE